MPKPGNIRRDRVKTAVFQQQQAFPPGGFRGSSMGADFCFYIPVGFKGILYCLPQSFQGDVAFW